MNNSLRKLLIASFAVLLSLGAASRAFAQSTGVIRGTVIDPSGAAITHASVTVTETSTSLSREAATNDSGIFVFPDLPIGTYALKIAASGFATQNRPGLTLLTGQVIDLPITLTVGAQTQQVTVTSETQQIDTSTSTVAQSVTQQQMRDLPLNGRNPLQLTTLTAGAVITTAGTENTQQDNPGLSVNGLRATENTYTLDGTIYVDRFFDSVPTMPNPDALQEFTIQAANYSADHAGAGALVQLSTRSGTSELHGEAWEYFRNTVLNARNYFWHQSYEPPFKMNQFGGTVGGPVFSSKKAFFFFSAEDLQQRSAPTPITIQVPTPAELTGDFSAFATHGVALYDPSTGCGWGQTGTAPTCSGTITDKTSKPMNTLSAALTKQYLQSEINASSPVTGSKSGEYNTLTTSTNNNIDNTQYLVRLDYSIGNNDHLSGRYFYNQDNFQRPFTAPLGFYAANLFRNQALTISDAHVFSNTLTGAIYVGAFRGARTQIPEAPGLKTLKDLGQTINYGSPTENLVPFPGVRANLSYINVFSGGALTQDSTTFDFTAQLVKVLHTHTLSFGGEVERDRIDMDDYSYTPGDNSFSAQQTQAPTGTTVPSGFSGSGGDPFASFYLGYESTFFEDNGRKAYLRELRPAIYFQDDWKVNSKLTLNLGLRWDPWMPPIDDNGTLVGFNVNNPNFQSTVAPGAPKGMWFVGDPGLPGSVFSNNFKDLAPRVGFAENLFGNGKTVVRGAYGIFYGFPEGLLYQRTDAMQPIDLYLNIPAPQSTWDNIYGSFSGGDPFPRGHITPSQFKSYTFLQPLSGGVLNPASKVEYTEAYNFTIEQDLSHGFAMNVGWVGNHAEHVMASRQFNPAVGAPSSGVENSYRIYPGLAAVELADAYDYAMTNAMEINVTRRSAHGLTLLSNVVWMKTIDNGSSGTEGQNGPPNPFNLNSARGVADFDQALRFTTSANYPFPRFHVSSVAGAIVNGWQANAIITSQSGLPITITSGVDNSHSGINNDYADFVPGVSLARPAGVSKITAWFNPAAFTKNAVGTFGNVPRNILRGPAYEDTDISLFKDFATEHRIHGQFQAEAFNAWNHTNLANPTNSASSGTFGQITSTSTATGTVNSPSTAGAQRVWQFALKMIF
ncbi:putative TonB-dependent receptor plug [Candidatus Sulfotelmatomonas gaucii]|uniref:Putative TonB-dependent receptor plug n=1 Tax=Candidatus Sulfuritelmatomonas gaucii TaxID=2043161 RepID=A0A2N9LCM1_9BACT|nr:putative TonB-dependent receptor plug [Candidatus Sulfotelmatomonas gaucii]